MARKKKTTPPKPVGRVSVIHILGPPADRDWLTGLHAATHIPRSTIVRLALRDWAAKHGHALPPWP